MALPAEEKKVWTYDDYRQLPDDGNRYEVIGGQLLATPAPRTFHQKVSQRFQFRLYELQQSGRGYVFAAPVEVIMPNATPVQPDLVYLRSEQKEIIEEKSIVGIPHLLVEILSPSTASRDRTLKLNTYAQAGVPHYWIVDPKAKTLEVFHLSGNCYQVVAALDEGGTYEAGELEGLKFELKELFAPL